MSSSDYASSSRQDFNWNLLLIPLLALLYYTSAHEAFAKCLTYALDDSSDVNPAIVGGPIWGSHWIYRLFAEAASVFVSCFVPAGLFREHSKQASVIAGFTISVSYVAFFVFFISSGYRLSEPWYQHAISGLVIFGAPLLSTKIFELADDLNKNHGEGFAGINKWHFAWLWIVLYFYGLSLISPAIHFYLAQEGDPNMFGFIKSIPWALLAIPVALPIWIGLSFLSGEKGAQYSNIIRNLIGTTVLALGWLIGTAVQVGALLALGRLGGH